MDAAPLATHSQPTLRIFVGCTSVDLQRHRHAARHLIEKFDEHAVVMEDFGAQDGDATQVSLAEVAFRRRVYTAARLALWHDSHGSPQPIALRHPPGVPRRPRRWQALPDLPADPATEADDGPQPLPCHRARQKVAAQVRAFRDEVGRDRVAAFFTSPESAALEIAVALHRLLRAISPNQPRPPVKSARRAPGFVGRTRELAALCQQLRAGQSVGLCSGFRLESPPWLRRRSPPSPPITSPFPGGVTFVRCDGHELDCLASPGSHDQLLERLERTA